ncbi:MAG: polyphosphate glucokinase [Saprospiraceae bacterium]|jgi:polyphosphate glucokinase
MGKILGIDVGGTGIKAALVDTDTGVFIKPKIKYATPRPSTPKNVSTVINKLIDDFEVNNTFIGCGFPSIIKDNVCMSAANIDDAWIGVNLAEYLAENTNCKGVFLNDADAAGLAEMQFGAGKGRMGTVLMITLGTGIGSGLFVDNRLVPNAELGHLLYKKSVFEHYASNGARKKKDLSWKEWGKELNAYLDHLKLLLSPDLIILGGGVSKEFDQYKKYLKTDTEIVQAQLMNNAGIVGAAMNAYLSQQ